MQKYLNHEIFQKCLFKYDVSVMFTQKYLHQQYMTKITQFQIDELISNTNATEIQTSTFRRTSQDDVINENDNNMQEINEVETNYAMEHNSEPPNEAESFSNNMDMDFDNLETSTRNNSVVSSVSSGKLLEDILKKKKIA